MGIDIVAKSSHRFNAVRTRFITAGRDAQTHISLRTVTICEHAAACAQQYDWLHCSRVANARPQTAHWSVLSVCL